MGNVLWVVVLLVVIAAVMLVLVVRLFNLKFVTIYEFQRGLKYVNGRYRETLQPGQYWISGLRTAITPVDVRAQYISIPGQEVLTSDGVSLKVSIAAEFEVADPNLAINKNVAYQGSLYLVLQTALREIIAGEKIDHLLENRGTLSNTLMDKAAPKASEMGIKLTSASIKDMMFTGEMKRTFSQVVKAQKEGLAALEKARGETAALRNLANAARMIQDNPNLLQLRALQTLGESTGNTLVLGVSNGLVPVSPNGGKKPQTPDNREEPEQE